MYSADFTEVANFHRVISISYNNLKTIRLLPGNLSSLTRRFLVNAYVLSIVQYAAFSFVSLPLLYHTKLHKLFMTLARFINASYDFKTSCKNIYLKAQILNEHQIMVIGMVNIIMGIIKSTHPAPLYSLLRFPSRNCKKITIISNTLKLPCVYTN